MTKINPRKEFLKRVKKMKFVDGKEVVVDQYFDKYAVKEDNEDMTNTTFNDLISKVDEVLKNQKVIIDLLSRENRSDPFLRNKISAQESNKKKVYKVRVYDAAKVFVGYLEDGVVEFVSPKGKFLQLRNDSNADKPFTFYSEWYITDDSSSNRVLNYILITPKNKIMEIPAKDINNKQYPCSVLENCVTGYLTEDGRAIYYDQYL